MADALVLKLVTGTTSYIAFTINATPHIKWSDIYRPSTADPRPLEAQRILYEFRRCKVVAATPDLLWTAGGTVKTFITALKTRGSGAITSAKIYYDAAMTKEADSISTGFQIDEVETDVDDEQPLETFLTRMVFTLRMSAFEPHADSSTGIVTFRQVIEEGVNEDGRAWIRYTTDITTAENTSAATKLATYGKIPALIATTYATWDTGNAPGGTGVDVRQTDADGTTGGAARVPTVARGVSQITFWGAAVGGSGPGTAPHKIDLVTLTDTHQEGGSLITTTTTVAEAWGPNAKAWVLDQAPTSYSSSATEDHEARQGYKAIWSSRSTPSSTVELIAIHLAGGGRSGSCEPAAVGCQAIEFEGQWLPLFATVEVVLRKVGTQPGLGEMALHGELGPPFIFRPHLSTEDGPSRVPPIGLNRGEDTWERRAVLVYESPCDPGERDLAREILQGPTRVSFKLGWKP